MNPRAARRWDQGRALEPHWLAGARSGCQRLASVTASRQTLTRRLLPSLPIPPGPRPGSDQRLREARFDVTKPKGNHRRTATLPHAELSAHNPNRTALSRAQLQYTANPTACQRIVPVEWPTTSESCRGPGPETRALFASGSAVSALSVTCTPSACASGRPRRAVVYTRGSGWLRARKHDYITRLRKFGEWTVQSVIALPHAAQCHTNPGAGPASTARAAITAANAPTDNADAAERVLDGRLYP